MAGFFCLQWHITNRCDQRCQHCYIFNSNKPVPNMEWDIETAKTLVKDLVEFCKKHNKIPYISLTGGDPLLHPYFWEIVGIIHEYKISFNILGNPFHLNKKMVNKLIELGCHKYQLSLDGLECTHDAMRRAGSFKATIDAIKLLKSCKLSSVIMTTVSKKNWQEIPDLTRLIVDLGVDRCGFARYCPTHNDTENNLTAEEYHVFLNQMWDIYSELSDRGTIFTLKDHLWKPILYEKGLLIINDDDVVYDGCHCGIAHLTVLEDGKVYACRRMETPIGRYPNAKIEELFFGKELDYYRNIHNIQGCKDCILLNYCRGCRAVAFGSSGGDALAKDPQCWFH